MKKLLLSSALAATLSVSAMADSYLGAGVAYESVTDADAGVALVLNGGATVLDAGPGKIAVEGEFTYSVVSPSISVDSYYRSYDADITFMFIGAYAAYIYDITPEFYVKPRLGLVYEDVDVSSASDSDIGLSFGIGAGYNVTKEISTYIDFTMMESDVYHTTLGVQYHF